jgi:hypothetical protein
VNRVAVSLLNFHGAQSTIACVQSLLQAAASASSSCRLEIFIFDNGSGAGEQQRLAQTVEQLGDVHLECSAENLGFSAGHNRNLETIFSRYEPDYVWLLNNDCLVAEQSLGALVEQAERHPQVGIWGATLLEPDGETIQCAGGCFYNAWVSSYRQYGRGTARNRLDRLQTMKYDYIAGASLFFPVATLLDGLQPLGTHAGEKPGRRGPWLNESFFLYFEELDLAKRLRPGIEMGWCRDALIRHESGASAGTSDNRRSVMAEYHSSLSALKFTRCYYPHRLWVTAPVRYVSKCLILLLRGDFRLIGVTTKAYWHFWTNQGRTAVTV